MLFYSFANAVKIFFSLNYDYIYKSIIMGIFIGGNGGFVEEYRADFNINKQCRHLVW